MPSIIQYAFTGEAVINSGVSVASILFPDRFLSSLVSGVVPASTRALFKEFNAVALGLTVSMVMCVPDSKDAAAIRKVSYATFAAIEVAVISVLLWEARKSENRGLTANGLTTVLVSLAPTLAWHLYVLVWRPRWFEVAKGQYSRPLVFACLI
ncbi:hypothetical protein NM208_g397 [Fusarium decemcellulare]|uniref:Uncharacterized protein n=2 Tax=Fusarium decemcellulare TaxID=57161 RepID=A0ACC1SZX6_9HYPO|nr:hypothetical protein NM208_g3908 [Fusarium decemcellulare]KAJ3549655.1 hypothetical protein NM208_g397 [Fusarium decemcellulare]